MPGKLGGPPEAPRHLPGALNKMVEGHVLEGSYEDLCILCLKQPWGQL